MIKIDPASPLYGSASTVILGLTYILDKRSILVDVGSSGGREIFEKLVESAHVVIWNAPDRQETHGARSGGAKNA